MHIDEPLYSLYDVYNRNFELLFWTQIQHIGQGTVIPIYCKFTCACTIQRIYCTVRVHVLYKKMLFTSVLVLVCMVNFLLKLSSNLLLLSSTFLFFNFLL